METENQHQTPEEPNQTLMARKHARNRLSYRETLTGNNNSMQGDSQSNESFGVDYPESDDDTYEKDEDKEHYSVICLTKEEKIFLRKRWRQSFIIKVWGKKVGYNYLLKKKTPNHVEA